MSELKLEQIGHPDAVSNSLTFDSDGTLATTTGFSSGGLKVKSSGGGIFSINPPSSASDRTLVLPDEAGTVITSGSYVAGITEVDAWYTTAAATNVSTDTDITANWARGPGTSIGTGMTESSGVFSFPSTGKWLVMAQMTTNGTSAGLFYSGHRIMATTNNSTYNPKAAAWQTSSNASGYMCSNSSFFFDVTDIANCKVKLRTSSSGNQDVDGGSYMDTGMTFIRFGDT